MEITAPRGGTVVTAIEGWLALSASRVLQVLLFAAIFLLNFFMVTDPDLWWHLATGRYIVETGSIPHADPFSYTAAGRPWIAHGWLAEVVMYLLYRMGGYLLPVIAFALVITLTFLAVFRTLRTMQASSNVAVCITFWVAFMSLAGWNVRPQVFSYLFVALYLYVLVRSRKRTDRWIWALPAIMVLWVNLHAGYIMGFAVLGLFLLGEGINRRRDRTGSAAGEVEGERTPAEGAGTSLMRRLRRSPLGRWVAVIAATLAATAANPQGLTMLLYPFTYASTQSASIQYVGEWQSPDFHDYFYFVFAASFMLLMVKPGRGRMDWALALPVLVLLAMSLQSLRVIPFYAIAVAPLLAQRLTGDRNSDRPTSAEGQTSKAHTRRQARSLPANPLNWFLLAVSLAILTSTVFLAGHAQLGPEPRTAKYPKAGVEYLKETGTTERLFNLYRWGGFIIWSFYPEKVAFVDGRADMYGDLFIEDYVKVRDALPGWEDVLGRYGVETALVEKDGRMATLLHASPEWEEVFQGPIESVFRRVSSEEDRSQGSAAPTR